MAPFANPAFPPRHHPENFKLSEYYYERDMGKETSRKTTLEENLARKGADSSTAGSMLSLDVEPARGGRRQTPEQRHKAAFGRVQHHMKRLASTINSTESQLPALKRRISSVAYSQLKHGVSQSRDVRGHILDQLEDYKAVPDECNTDLVINALQEMQKEVQEHVSALQDAMRCMLRVRALSRSHLQMMLPPGPGASQTKKNRGVNTNVWNPCQS